MFTPRSSYSSEILLDVYGTYLIARLKADPTVASVHAGFEKAQVTLTKANDRQRSSRRIVQETLSARDFAAFVLSRQVSQFQLAVLAHVDRERSSPLYGRYFPDGITGFAGLSLARLIEKVKVFETDLASAADAVALKSWAAKFADVRGQVEKAIAAWQQAKVVHTEAQNAEVTERANWLNAYRTVHADLVKLSPADRKKVETFFRPGPASSRDAGPEEVAPAA